MQKLLPQTLISLAKALPTPLYVVGGSVRDHLANLQKKGVRDLDICAPLAAQDFASFAKNAGFFVQSVYKNTGTVKLRDNTGADYEYSAFRSDKYIRGVHTPVEIFFTDDINLDCRRRDFTCNAVYYDIQANAYVDPLDGITAIKEKRLTTVAPADKVFGEDGLRLMRLARQAAQLGFTPDNDCLCGAQKNAALIRDITPQRIYAELTQILHADEKYGVKNGQYHGIKLLEETGVLTHILPELTLGKGIAQRADFHKYDILEHSLRTLLYAQSEVRLAALLHDVGKPFCALRDGNVHAHPDEGERIAGEILTRLGAPKKTVSQVKTLVKWHMYDFNCQTGENKLRRFFVENYSILDALMLVKQADFSACTDDTSVAPTLVKWQALLAKMRAEGVAFTLKELAVNGTELLSAGLAPQTLSQTLHALLLHVAVNPKDNEKARLIKLAKSFRPCEP